MLFIRKCYSVYFLITKNNDREYTQINAMSLAMKIVQAYSSQYTVCMKFLNMF